MKIIDKIIIFKKDGKPFNGFVLYDDSTFKEFNYKNLVKEIIKFSNQEECTIDDLYHEKRINVYKNCDKYDNVKNRLKDGRKFALSKHVLDLFLPISIIMSIISVIFTNFVYIGSSIVDNAYMILSSYYASVLALPTIKLHNIGRKYNMKGIKKYGFFTMFSLVMSFSSLYQRCLPPIETIPYYFELTHTDIEDTGDYDGLSDKEKHIKACETIFRNVKFNPYLDDMELESLYNLKSFVMENPYLDMDDVLHKFMTIRVKERISLNKNIGATYDPISNTAEYYPNNWNGEKEDAIEHEYLHSIGYLDNDVLNEGMTSLLAGDIEKIDNMYYDGYIYERFCMQYVIELVGKDLALEAYSKNNISLIDNALSLKFGGMEKVEEFYALLDKNCRNDFDEQEIIQFIIANLNEEDKEQFIENGTIELDGKYYTAYKRRYDFSDESRLIKKSY